MSETTSESIGAQTKVKAAEGQMSCDLAGEAAILNMATGIYYGLDEVGARIWELIQDPKSVTQVRDALLEEYEVEPSVLESDVVKLLADMKSHGLIEIL
jgi:hypothetical protein